MVSSSPLNSMLPPIFLSGTIVMPDYPQPSRPPGTTSSDDSSPTTSSAQLAPDAYTSSQPPVGNNSDSSGISQSALEGYENYVSPTQQAWQTLEQSLASGDISAAQSALSDYTRSLPNSNLYLSTLTTPSTQFLKDLADLGTAISDGNLADAQSIFKNAQQDQPETADQALAAAIAKATSDGANATSWMEDLVSFGTETAAPAINATSPGYLTGLSSGGAAVASDSQFTGDLATVEGILMESNASVGDYLRSQGYAAAPVSIYVSGLNRTDTLGMLPGLADSIGQVNQTESGALTIFNSGSASIAGSTDVSAGTVEDTSIGSMYDAFSYTLTKSYTDPSAGASIVLEHSATLVSGNSTQLTYGTVTSSEAAASVDTGNQTQDLAYELIRAFNYDTTATNEVVLSSSDVSIDA